MADLKKTVEIIFAGNDMVSKKLNVMSRNISRFGTDISKIGDPFHQLTKGVIALDAAIAALIVGGLAYSINQFASFEDKMLKVKGVLGATEDEYRILTDLTKELGATTRYTAAEAASGLEFLALAGMNTTQAMQALPEVLQLAQAAAVDLKTAADIVTNIMAGYGIAVEGLSRTNDVLTAAFTNSNTSLQQLGVAFQYVGPVAKSLGFEIEETAAVLGILGNAGYQAEKGGTALRNIMLALVAPAGNMGKLMKELGVDTKEMGVDFADSRNALDSLGVTIKDSSGKLLPFSDILGQIKTGLEKISDPADRTATLIEIFGKRGGPQMAALLSQGADSIDNLKDKINSMGGITKSIADEMESGAGGIKRALISAFDAVFIEIGGKASDAAAEGAEGMVEVLRAVAGTVKSDTFKPLFDVLEKFSDQLGADLQIIAKNLPEAFKGVDFDELIKAFEDLAGVFGSTFEDVDVTSIEGLKSALQGVVDSLSLLVNTSTGIAEILTAVGRIIVDVVESLKSLDKNDWQLIGNLAAIGTALTGLAGVLAVGGALITGISALSSLFAAGGVLSSGIAGVVAILAGPAGLAVALGAVAAAAINFSFGDMNKEHEIAMAEIGKHTDKINDLISQMEEIPAHKSSEIFVLLEKDDLEGAQKLIDELVSEERQILLEAKVHKEEFDNFFEDWTGVSDEKSLEITAAINAGDFDRVNQLIATIPEEKEVAVRAVAEIEHAKEEIEWFDNEGNRYTILVDVDTAGVEKAKKDIENIPTEKMIEIQMQGDIDIQLAQIKASAQVAQSSFEWTAKLDIAEVEAQVQIIESAYDSINTSINSTADLMGKALGALSDAGSLSEKWAAQDILRDEAKLREKSFSLQEKLTNSQVDYMNAKTEGLKSGNSIIKISSDGLEPTLEMIMWKIIEKVQIRANAEAADMLLGL